MEIYLLKSAACLGIFFLFYKLVLENTSLHTTKRFFLLSGLVLSFLIPFVTFTEYIEVTPVVTEAVTQVPYTTFEPAPETVEPINYLPYILGGIYGLGVLIFGFRFGRSMFRIFQKVRKNPTVKKHSIFHVLLKLPVTPHSFFNYIFFNRKEYEADEIPKEVMVHETAHVEQKHSWDIVFIEVLRIVFWFNPLLYFFKHSIKLNHEFLADRSVLEQGADSTRYQTILLDFSSASSVPAMAHSINYSSTRLNGLFSKDAFGQVKKRFTVMKTHTTKRAAWLKGLLILPLLAVLIYGFSETKQEFETTQTIEKVSDKIVIAENLRIYINETGGILVNENLTDFDNLSETLELFNSSLSFTERRNNVLVHIYAEENIPMNYLFEIKDKLRRYGISRMINHPTANEESATDWREKTIQKISETSNQKGIVQDILDLTLMNNTLVFEGDLYSLTQFKQKLNPLDYSSAKVALSSGVTEPFVQDVIQFLTDVNLGNNLNFLVGDEARKSKINTRRIMENIVRKVQTEQATPKHSYATLAQYDRYVLLAKKYNAIPKDERQIPQNEYIELQAIYMLMNDSQLEMAPPFPEILQKPTTSWGKEYAKTYNEGAARNSKKSIVITVNVSEIMVNGKTTSLKNFAKEIDRATKDWNVADFKAAHPSVLVAGTPDSFMKKLDAEFRKTRYFKANNEVSIIPTSPPPPPPPAPDAPRVLKGVNDTGSNIPPPPPPPAPGAPKINKGVNSSHGNIPPPPPAPKVIKGVNDGSFNTPPPPPPPKSPLDHIIEMAKNNATFYFEGKQITSDKAIEIIKKNKDLNIQTTGSSSKNPQVKISTKPITFDPDKKTGSVGNKQKEFPKLTAGNVISHLKVMNRHGASFYLNGSEITFNEALKLVRKDLRQGYSLDVSSDSDKNETYINGNTSLTGVLGTTKQEKVTLRLMLFDPPTISPNTTSKDPKQLVELLDTRGASFWNEKAKISKKDALKLIEKYSHFMIDTTQTPHDKPSIVFDVVVIK